jgi:NAD+ synthase (glutamine-hydrolysing)
MWHEDYPFNPTKSLVENGAEIVFNLSASPWTWQKNRKRHRVVKKLISKCQVPFVYVNNTGIQNIGKNIVVFDGGSAVYNRNGDIVLETVPYSSGWTDFSLSETMPVLTARNQSDTEELYLALKCAIMGFVETLPPSMRKIVIGLSGGIDSALVAALFVDILGAENVIAINMPTKYNSKITKSIARKIARNLGIKYKVRPIQKIVNAISKATEASEDSLAYENIQARARTEILAAEAQILERVFSANWNKIEAAFGYGTLYGDMAGFMAPIGDLIKREVYQLADYMNREVFGSEVIPKECFEIKPTAELKNDHPDPFDYGNLSRRGYHDEMIRAFVEFRRNPQWFLEQYDKGLLEEEFKLEKGTLDRLFPDVRYFIEDLERNWTRLHGSYFKRLQGPMIPIISKRAFGSDLRESILSAHFTQRYLELREEILQKRKR